MPSSGFSAPTNYWGTITGLTPKSSNKGAQNSVAEAKNAKGDVVASDTFGQTLAPSVDFVVTDDFENTNNVILLGKIFSFEIASGTTRKFMLTQVVVTTSAGTPPTVTISGVQVENAATTKRTYPISLNLSPRSKAQDVAGAFTGNVKFTQIVTTFSVDPVVQTVGGWPVSSDCANGKVEVAGSFVYSSTSQSWGKANGWDTITQVDESAPDGDYIARSLTCTKYLSGTDA